MMFNAYTREALAPSGAVAPELVVVAHVVDGAMAFGLPNNAAVGVQKLNGILVDVACLPGVVEASAHPLLQVAF